MPFVVRDPWRVQYFQNVPCPADIFIAVDDLDCWDFYPKMHFIYDKLFIAQSQGLMCGLADDPPLQYPVFAKPRVNLKGMGLGSFSISDATGFATRMTDGHIWMEQLVGPHISTDCAVVDGAVCWSRQSTGSVWSGGMFKHWVIEAEDDPILNRSLAAWIKRVLPGYTGMINIETICGCIIEAQLRFSDQWCDLYGLGFLEAVVRFYATGQWFFAEPARIAGYSVPLFIRHGNVPSHPPPDVQEMIRTKSGISSLQITFHEGKPGAAHTMPPGGFRLAVINAWDLDAGIAARAELAKAFQGCDVLLP
jgi:hypothetical protein